MKQGSYIQENELLKDGWIKLVRYGSIANIFTKNDKAVIVNSLDNQVIRYVEKEELEKILKQWKNVLSATEFLR